MSSKVYDHETLKEMAMRRWGLAMRKEGRRVVGAPCPECRKGRDNCFMVYTDGGNFYCRYCQCSGWIDDDKADWKPDPELSKFMAERLESELREKQDRVADWRDGYRAGFVAGWHAAMTEAGRDYWRGEGIPDWAIDFYALGHCPNKRFEHDGDYFESPAHVIPIYEPKAWELVQIQYRLEKPPPGVGKYRQEAGLPPAAFYALQGVTEGNSCIVLEGSKKAIVVAGVTDFTIQVIGWPSATPSEWLMRQLEGFKYKYVMLDPGANMRMALERVVKVFGKGVRIVDLPAKPDDLVVRYGYTADDYRELLRQARRV